MIKNNSIDEIILTSGSSRIPKIQEMLKNYFGKEINKSIEPDEAIACGATIQAAIINNYEDDDLERLILLDIIPVSLGIELGNGIIFLKNT